MANPAPVYDTIGVDYSNLRKPDPRIARLIDEALGTAQTILNVGAGTGNYEPKDRRVTALEPSAEMIGQRSADAAPAVQGCAEDLPFDDDSFDAAMALLTVHHWADKAKGLQEMRRVATGPVVLHTFDPACRESWLSDYIPELITLDEGMFPALSEYERWLGPVEIAPVPIPHDCTDGFLAAYWRRPEAYLDARIRSGISSFWLIENVDEGLAKLSRDLESGVWHRRYAHLLEQTELDAGYRLVKTI